MNDPRDKLDAIPLVQSYEYRVREGTWIIRVKHRLMSSPHSDIETHGFVPAAYSALSNIYVVQGDRINDFITVLMAAHAANMIKEQM